MEITISQAQRRVPVSVIHISGQLDSQTYQTLIAKATETVNAGAKDILLDLSGLTYISSAGLIALHTIALLVRGESLPGTEGWSSLKKMDNTRDGGLQKHIKLLNPQPDVMGVLDMVGYLAFFEVLTDQQKAVDSF
jgi:ABC-type transporter Mla MlaB component